MVRRIQLRQVIFWLHLVAGIVAGLVIGVMSLTGVLLAFERQILAAAEHHMLTVPPPAAGVPRLDLDAVVARASATVPAERPSGVTLRADPAAAAMVNFGREYVVFVDPYSGAVLGEGAHAWRHFFHVVTDWHRWLGAEGERRDLGRAITGACKAAFVVMVLTGVYLWWPRRWTRRGLKAITVPTFRLRGKPRDWNWHNVAGFWSAAALFCIALTGVVMSYQWASDLLYTLTGNTPPPRQPSASVARPAEPGQRTGPVPRAAGTGRQSRPEGRPAGEPLPTRRGTPQPRCYTATRQSAGALRRCRTASAPLAQPDAAPAAA